MNAIFSLFSSSERPCSRPRRVIGAGHPPPKPTPSLFNGQARIETFEHHVPVIAYPTQGGFVALEDATGVDFEFLGLDPVNPLQRRLPDQSAEDEFAKRLLLLGAKW
jgi:hypothetical protein